MTEQGLQLGISKDVLVLHKHEQLTETLADMVSQSRSALRIFSYDLEPHVYNHLAICTPLAEMINRNRFSNVQVLVQNIDAVGKVDHCLVELMRKLSSFVEIRVTAQEHSRYDHAFAVIDDCGYYHRHPQDSREFEVCYNDRGKAKNLLDEFNTMWEHGVRASELLQLYI